MQKPIVTLGEALIDFLSLGPAPDATIAAEELFKKQPGGAPMNVACGVARLGYPAAFVGKLGDDDFGRFLKHTMERFDVDTSGLVLTREARTGLAFVSLDDKGDRSFTFYRDPSADMLLSPTELDVKKLENAAAFHFGSISLITEPSGSATRAARDHAHRGGALISYDPNLREPLWPSLDVARATILDAMPLCDLVKVSEEELAFLFPGTTEADGVRALLARGPKVVVLTRGAGGASAFVDDTRLDAPSPATAVVDTTGAGDAFVAALLVTLVEAGGRHALGPTHLERALHAGVKAGALSCRKHGALAALPTRDELDA